MKKINVLDKEGKKSGEIETSLFSGKIREDINQKIIESEKSGQEYAPFYLAGGQTSASENVRHHRHAWKSDRGKGMSRIPKKKMSRKGERFSWVGATIPGTRGGRKAHPPHLGRRTKKINKKELILGLKSALAMVSSVDLIEKKYKLSDKNKLELNLPIIVNSTFLNLKAKEFLESMKKILKESFELALRKKSIRAGKGKMRGRRYKISAGGLLVIGNKENPKANIMKVIKAGKIRVSDLASNGARITIFTENAIKDMEERIKDD